MLTLFDVLTAHQQNPGDGRVFGLVAQGGGMRGVYSCGALGTLMEYGFADTFEHLVGASAGAYNITYFLGKRAQAYRLYTEGGASKNFVNLLRPGKKLDVDYIIDVVMKRRPLDLHNLRQAHSQLHIVVTDASTGRKRVLAKHEDFAQIYEELRATSALPILYDKKIEIDGRQYVDGAVSDSLPIDVALKLGCTDIVVVLTQQLASFQFDRRHDRLIKRLLRNFPSDQSPAVRNMLPTNQRVLQANLRTIKQPLKRRRIYVLEPSDEQINISLGTIDKPKVVEFARLGIKDMDNFLHRPLTEN